MQIYTEFDVRFRKSSINNNVLHRARESLDGSDDGGQDTQPHSVQHKILQPKLKLPAFM